MCFVIPTYNEASNIVPLLRRLTGLYPDADTVFLIVDDESPDGTARLVREFAASDDRVRLLEGPQRGLGQAYVLGMVHALDTLGADVVVQMDADFSHDPADAGRLLARLADGGGPAAEPEAEPDPAGRRRSLPPRGAGGTRPRGMPAEPALAGRRREGGGADVAIGSRYVAGGTLDPRWHAGRRLLSRWGNRFARSIAGVRGVRDCTAGFKAIRADALRAAKVEDVRVRGHAFQVVLLHRLLHAGARIVEVPIHFRERERGQAKLGAGGILEFFWSLWRLRLAKHRVLVKYGLTGSVGALINLGTFQLLLDLGLHKFLASPIANEVSIVSNFLMNNYWTFAERNMAGSKRIRGLKYNAVALATLALNYATFVGLSILYPQALPVLLQACGIAPAAVLNYFMNSRWTFRETSAKASGGPFPG